MLLAYFRYGCVAEMHLYRPNFRCCRSNIELTEEITDATNLCFGFPAALVRPQSSAGQKLMMQAASIVRICGDLESFRKSRLASSCVAFPSLPGLEKSQRDGTLMSPQVEIALRRTRCLGRPGSSPGIQLHCRLPEYFHDNGAARKVNRAVPGSA